MLQGRRRKVTRDLHDAGDATDRQALCRRVSETRGGLIRNGKSDPSRTVPLWAQTSFRIGASEEFYAPSPLEDLGRSSGASRGVSRYPGWRRTRSPDGEITRPVVSADCACSRSTAA